MKVRLRYAYSNGTVYFPPGTAGEVTHEWSDNGERTTYRVAIDNYYFVLRDFEVEVASEEEIHTCCTGS